MGFYQLLLWQEEFQFLSKASFTGSVNQNKVLFEL